MPWLSAPTAVVLVVVVGGGVLALWLLNAWAARHQGGMSAEAAATLRLDAIKTALTVAAGLGAGVTLVVALRRQSVSERGQRHIEEDSQEQRITTLYVAAVEQLGSDKAAVRLGGLYALKRLGQDNPKLRQTVIDVICAYLRMPYTPPAEVLRDNAQHSPHALGKDDPDPDPDEQPTRRQELQVRLTAQRLLRDHTRAVRLGDEPSTLWRGQRNELMSLDLTGAVLVSFDLTFCDVEKASFGSAQLHGGAALNGAEFHNGASLDSVQFYGYASLRAAQFHEGASLSEAQFHEVAELSEAKFNKGVVLINARATEQATLPPMWTLAPETGERLRLVVRVGAATETGPPLTLTKAT